MTGCKLLFCLQRQSPTVIKSGPTFHNSCQSIGSPRCTRAVTRASATRIKTRVSGLLMVSGQSIFRSSFVDANAGWLIHTYITRLRFTHSITTQNFNKSPTD